MSFPVDGKFAVGLNKTKVFTTADGNMETDIFLPLNVISISLLLQVYAHYKSIRKIFPDPNKR